MTTIPKWAQVEAGRLPTYVLEQSEWWVNGQGEAIRVADMDERYRRTVVAFLARKGEMLRWSWALMYARMLPLDDDVADELLDAEQSMPFDQWLHTRPLVKALLS